MTCSLCDRPVHGRGWCSVHYDRWRRQGDPNVRKQGKPPVLPNPGYSAVHLRLKVSRGKAADFLCVDCGQQANHWSYKYGGGGGLSYSANLDDYEPRCRSCHMKLDMPRPVCSLDGCTEAHKAQGMCKRHYDAWRYKKRVASRNNERKEVQ